MQYYVSLPDGWSAKRSWPVVVLIDSADREFIHNTQAFIKARKHLPFILVSPLVVTNGGIRYREAPGYRYSASIWAEIDRAGGWAFDEAGLASVLADVRSKYRGEPRFFITGWEAGGHTLWAYVFQHPERLRAAAPACTNYQGRHLIPDSFSTSPARRNLPIVEFNGTDDEFCAPGKAGDLQWRRALADAKAHGFGNVKLRRVPGGTHGPLADQVMEFFANQYKANP